MLCHVLHVDDCFVCLLRFDCCRHAQNRTAKCREGRNVFPFLCWPLPTTSTSLTIEWSLPCPQNLSYCMCRHAFSWYMIMARWSWPPSRSSTQPREASSGRTVCVLCVPDQMWRHVFVSCHDELFVCLDRHILFIDSIYRHTKVVGFFIDIHKV